MCSYKLISYSMTFFYSVLGHRMPSSPKLKFNVYPASKFAVTAISKTMLFELKGTKIRTTVIFKNLF